MSIDSIVSADVAIDRKDSHPIWLEVFLKNHQSVEKIVKKIVENIQSCFDRKFLFEKCGTDEFLTKNIQTNLFEHTNMNFNLKIVVRHFATYCGMCKYNESV